MLSFIKAFFQGILYVLLSPVLLVVLVFNLIYGILIYFFYEFKSMFLFFRGLSYKSEDEETRMLKEIKNKMATPQFNPSYPNGAPYMGQPGVPPYNYPNAPQNPNVTPQSGETQESEAKNDD